MRLAPRGAPEHARHAVVLLQGRAPWTKFRMHLETRRAAETTTGAVRFFCLKHSPANLDPPLERRLNSHISANQVAATRWIWQSQIWSRGLAHVAPSTASYSNSMGRSVRSRLRKQHEHRWPTRFPSQAGGTLPASLTATIWSRQLGSHLCVSSDDVLEVGQGLQG